MIRAEILKLTRQRAALFWGFLAVPVFMTLIAFVLDGGLRPPPAGVVELHPFRSVARALAVGGNPVAQLFYATGAATIFAVDYRHSGWRHLVPRATRDGLLLAKFLTFALFAGGSLMLVAFGDALVGLLLPMVQGLSLARSDASLAAAGTVALSFLIGFTELLALGAIAGCIVVATRSAMPAILGPFLVALTAAGAEAYLGPESLAIPLPTFAGDALRLWLGGGPALLAPIGAATLAGWILLPIAAALAIFRRQDLVSE